MRNPRHYLLPVALGVLFLTSGCKPQQSQVQVPPAQALPRGQEIFLSHCASCHQGPGNPPGPNGVILGSDTLKSQSDFTALLRKPRSAMMTAFSLEALPDHDVKELYSYIMSVKGQ